VNIEEAMKLGNRHLTGNDKFEIETSGARSRRVCITASPSVAATHAGQHCLWMLTNLLARQFGVITTLQINVPLVPAIRAAILFGTGETLQDALVSTAKLVAGDAMDIVEGNQQTAHADAEAGVGRFQQQAPFSVAVLADGWRVLAGKPGVIPDFVPTSKKPLGPYFAACLAAGEIFKQLAGLKPGRGRPIEYLAFSLWDYQKCDSWEAAEPGLWPEGILLPPFYLVGAGAVGQAAIACLAACPGIGGYVTIIDDDAVDATNRNRYALAHSGNLGVNKALIAVNAVTRNNFLALAYPGRWEAYVQGLNRPEQRDDVLALEQHWKFQRVLSCVDKNGPRHSIQNVWPEIILGGSTFECGVLVQAYDLRTEGECLKCSNPIEQDGRTIEGETALWKQMTPGQRRQLAEQKGLNLQAIEDHLNHPECGQLGQQEIAKFVLDPRQDWSVGFVSVAAGVLLAAKLVQWEIAGVDAAFPPARGQALRFSFLNPGPAISRHLHKETCVCSGKGRRSYQRLWSQ